jgi:hypothetical protein
MQSSTHPNSASAQLLSAVETAVDEHEAAKIIGMSVFFLRKDRRTKRLIPFYRLGDRILYNPRRVFEALASVEEGGAHLKSRCKKVAGAI